MKFTVKYVMSAKVINNEKITVNEDKNSIVKFKVDKIIDDKFTNNTLNVKCNITQLQSGRFKLELRKELIRLSYDIQNNIRGDNVMHLLSQWLKVYFEILDNYKISLRNILKASSNKEKKRGSFSDKLFSEYLEMSKDNQFYDSYAKKKEYKLVSETDNIVKFAVNKLVRNNTVNDCASKEVTAHCVSLVDSDRKYKDALKSKLIEESREVLGAHQYQDLIDELADVLDVLCVLLKEYDSSLSELISNPSFQITFNEKLFLKDIELPRNHVLFRDYDRMYTQLNVE